jgi:hypothetical protein
MRNSQERPPRPGWLASPHSHAAIASSYFLAKLYIRVVSGDPKTHWLAKYRNPSIKGKTAELALRNGSHIWRCPRAKIRFGFITLMVISG